MRLAQVREQLELGILADDIGGTADLDAGLVELLDEPIDRDLQYFREIRDRNFRHSCLPRSFKPAALARTNERGQP